VPHRHHTHTPQKTRREFLKKGEFTTHLLTTVWGKGCYPNPPKKHEKKEHNTAHIQKGNYVSKKKTKSFSFPSYVQRNPSSYLFSTVPKNGGGKLSKNPQCIILRGSEEKRWPHTSFQVPHTVGVRLLNFWGERKRKKEKNTKGRVNFEGKEKKKRRLSFFSVLERYLICVRAQRKTNQTSKSKLPESVFHGGGRKEGEVVSRFTGLGGGFWNWSCAMVGVRRRSLLLFLFFSQNLLDLFRALTLDHRCNFCTPQVQQRLAVHIVCTKDKLKQLSLW